jgi:hypothetical protein
MHVHEMDNSMNRNKQNFNKILDVNNENMADMLEMKGHIEESSDRSWGLGDTSR